METTDGPSMSCCHVCIALYHFSAGLDWSTTLSEAQTRNSSAPLMDEDSEIRSRIAEIKLQRIQELNLKLKESLLRERIAASTASFSIINYTLETPDYLIPSIWKSPGLTKFQKYQIQKNIRRPAANSQCCTIT